MSKVAEITGWSWCIVDADLLQVTKLKTQKTVSARVEMVGG
jgi:hypothetical protein